MIIIITLTLILIQVGAELDAANHELDRPLHLAAGVGNLEVLRVILDTGGDLEARGWLQNTALHVAAQAAQVTETSGDSESPCLRSVSSTSFCNGDWLLM